LCSVLPQQPCSALLAFWLFRAPADKGLEGDERVDRFEADEGDSGAVGLVHDAVMDFSNRLLVIGIELSLILDLLGHESEAGFREVEVEENIPAHFVDLQIAEAIVGLAEVGDVVDAHDMPVLHR